MKKATNRILSFLTAFAMVIGVLVAPFASANAGEEQTTETVTLHKILMDKTTFGDFTEGTTGKDGTEYVGEEITNVKDFFAGKNAPEGRIAKEVPNVYFAVKYNSGNNAGKFVTIKEVDGQKPVYGAVDSLDDQLEQGFKLLAGETGANGITFTTSGLKGDFLIEEYHEKSTYVGDNEEALTDMKAVPVKITLPLVNNNGVVKDAHVYPKNTEEKPQIDKNFAKAKDGEKELEVAEGFPAADEGAGVGVGAEYKNYQAKKATAEAELGKKVPYEVKTQIPAKSNLAEAKWDDKMTEGLTYNKDLEVTIEYVEVEGEGEEAQEVAKTTTLTTAQLKESKELTESDNGFVLRLSKDGNLNLLNGKVKPVTVTLKYSATVNSNAIVDIPEANDIKFFYGNTPSKGTTPLPTKPNDNGQVTVEKTWDNGSAWEEGEWAKFKLVDANTGEDVKAEDLDKVEGYTFESVVELKKDGKTSYTWKGLKKDKQYKVVEVESKTLSDAEYKVTEQGKVEITNHKSNNPKPLNPTEPKVVLGGKKFVKTNNEEKDSDKLERLAGAEFYVKNGKGEDAKYLVAKDAATEEANAINVSKLSEAYKKAFDDYNKAIKEEDATDENVSITVGEKTITGKTAIKEEISKLYNAYEKALKESAKAYTWGDKADAVVLVSNEDGQFEITGLEYGTYYLEEKSAPAGYAKRNDSPEFKVEKGSYESTEKELKYEVTLAEGETQTYGLQVKNKKVSIPQTGGIGSLIFIVAGLAIMGLAFVMKRRNAVEA